MSRSRVTLASTLAAATQAATRSPFQTARPGTPSPSTGKPSVSTYSGSVVSEASARRMAERLQTCRPRASTSAGGMMITEYASARTTTSAYTRSRAAGVSSLESASPSISPRLPSGRMAAAATSGPAHAPRPASSAPATNRKPRRCSARSSAYSPASRRMTVRVGVSMSRSLGYGQEAAQQVRQLLGIHGLVGAVQFRGRPPPVGVDGAPFLRIEAGRVDPPLRHPVEVEVLVLPVPPVVVAELDDLVPDGLAQLGRTNPQAGFLEQLPGGALGRRLARVQPAARGEPPAQAGTGRIAAAEQQGAAGIIDQDDAGGWPV